MNKLLEKAGERVLRRVLPNTDAQAFSRSDTTRCSP